MFSKFWRLAIVLILIAGSAIAIPVQAQSAGPSFDVSFNPSGGQTVGGSVTIHVRVNSSNPGATRIQVSCGGVSKAETSEVEFDSNWNTGGCSEGNQSVTVQARASDDPNWSSANTQSFNYYLSANQPAPQPQQPSISCSVDSFDVSPRSANIGDNIHIEGSGSCNVGVRATRVLLDGGSDIYEIGSPNLSTDWNTTGNSLGQHKLVLQVAGWGDNNWSQAAKSSPIYIQIGSPSQPAPAPSCPFNASDVINIKGDIFVMDGSCTRHLVPNPDTLDALGIPRAWVDNKGLSNADLKALHRGSDVPDVNRDYQGFIDFKNRYFPNTTPINPSGNNSQPQQPSGAGTFIPVPQGPTGSTGDCPNAPTMVKPGDIAIITDFSATDNSLNIRNNPSVNADVIGQIPIGAKFTVIAGPKCKGEIRWYEVGYNGIDGWSAEVSWDGQYNYVPNGYLPRPNTSAGNPALNNNPTAPAQQSTQQQTNKDQSAFQLAEGNYTCEQLPDNRTWLDKLLGVAPVDAAEQCTQYVYRVDTEVEKCWGSNYPDAGLWDDKAKEYSQKCGWGVTNDFSKAQPGDIVVWNGADQNSGKNCAQADAPGHVAIFDRRNSDGTICVNGSNWSGDQCKVTVDTKCMSVIHTRASKTPTAQTSAPKTLNRCSGYAWWDPRGWWCKVFGG